MLSLDVNNNYVGASTDIGINVNSYIDTVAVHELIPDTEFTESQVTILSSVMVFFQEGPLVHRELTIKSLEGLLDLESLLSMDLSGQTNL